eukprot:1006382-Prorocentrum_lima.AAC.1
MAEPPSLMSQRVWSRHRMTPRCLVLWVLLPAGLPGLGQSQEALRQAQFQFLRVPLRVPPSEPHAESTLCLLYTSPSPRDSTSS